MPSAVPHSAVDSESDPMKKLLALLTLGLALTLTGCTPAEPIEVTADTIIIDVRTPDEFATGHLEGALLLDVQSAEFDALAAELDPDASYIVYCRSGNRAGTAIERLAALGITDAVNAGSVQEASDATGVPIVTE